MPIKKPRSQPIIPPTTDPIVQTNANLNVFWGAAKVKPAKSGSTGIGKIIDSINEIKARSLLASGLTAFSCALEIKELIL